MLFIVNPKNQQSVSKLLRYLSQLKDEKYSIEIEKFKITRSSSQNRLYWAYLRLIAHETGQDEDLVHEYCKRRFLPPRMVEIFGQEIKLPATTTNLSKLEFMEYLDKIERLTGVPIPNKEEL